MGIILPKCVFATLCCKDVIGGEADFLTINTATPISVGLLYEMYVMVQPYLSQESFYAFIPDIVDSGNGLTPTRR